MSNFKASELDVREKSHYRDFYIFSKRKNLYGSPNEQAEWRKTLYRWREKKSGKI